MRKIYVLTMLIMIPLLYADQTDTAPSRIEHVGALNPADSPIDPAPPISLSTNTGRGLGDILLTINTLPLGIDGPSGLSWDGQYLYVVSLINDSLYVVDPFVPSVITSWPSPAIASAPYGSGIEQNLWITTITPDSAYEYTLSGTATGNVFLAAPSGASYCADGSEWWQSGELWLVGIGSACGNQCFKFSVPDGTVLDSIGDPLWTGQSQRGLSFDPFAQKFWLGGWNSDSVWELNLDGSPTGRSFFLDGCAGIAYDWQSSFHPTPVLWITRQGADQIVMVDADNPNPSPNYYVWDFEDGWQGWTRTGAFAFPNGWAVMASNYNGTTWLIPDAGDSSFWFDDDEAGSMPSLQDTALSPVVSGLMVGLFKWGVSYNWYATGEFYEVGLKYFNGSIWQAAPLRNYTADVTPRWDSADVSAYAGYDSLQVYFYYDDGWGWQWYGAFDNVGLYPVLDHDVGAAAFLSPGTMVAPGSDDVVGVVANYGSAEETYDVHCVVNDNTFAVVLDTTINATTGVGETDTITFGTLYFVEGRAYDLMMATLLSGDVNPTNDTLEQSTYCTWVFWEVLAAMPVTTSGPFTGYATINDTLYVHVFGGNPTASQTLHHIYNTWTGTWAVGTPLPNPANYGGCCSIDNKIYMIGAFTQPANTYMTIYDAESDIYTTVALPVPINDPGIAVVDNNYIYIIGGSTTLSWTPSTNVMLYDVAGDSFFTGVTQLPGAIMAGVGGYLGNDTLIHAAGLMTGSIYVNTTYLGYINPSNPASITWTTGPDKPGTGTYRLNGASYISSWWPGRLYVAAGAITGGYTANTYLYESGSGWATLPDKPTAHSNFGCVIAQFSPMSGVMYAAGGYTGSYLNIFHALHLGPTAIFEQPGEAPTAFGFNLLTSNPVVDRVRFQFDMPYQGTVNFSVYDIAGRRVLDSDFSNISAGTHTMVWDRTDNQGREVANGIYFYRVEAAGNVATGKLILVR